MNIEEANAVIDRLNAAFNGHSSAIPEGGEIRDAIKSLIEEAVTRGGREDEIPSGVGGDSTNINRDTNTAIVGIRDYVNKLIEADESRKALENHLTRLPKIIQKKIKI
jgi:hypothetical protein